MRRTELKKENKGPVMGPAEETGVSSLFTRKHGFSFALNTFFPWFMFVIALALTAWIVHLALQEQIHPVVFTRKWALWGLLILLPLAYYNIKKDHHRNPAFNYSRLGLLTSIRPGLKTWFRFLPVTLKLMALGLLIFSLAGPALVNVYEETDEKGVDIIIALDVSLSMEANDLEPNRLMAAKEVVADFIKRRPNDRIGLVVFGVYAYPYCPLTLDHNAVTRLLGRVNLRVIDDGRATAIGEALGTSLNMLRRSKSKSRMVILLTDGDNNAGEMSPKEAAQHGAAMGVKIHTVLMGDPSGGGGKGPFRLFRMRSPVNPALLEHISSKTGGTSYLATDKQALRDRFQKLIDKMEKNKYISRFRTNRGIQTGFILAAFLILMGAALLENTWLRRFP